MQAALAGRYQIERTVGSGAMAVVFQARRVDGGQVVALKVMRPEIGYEDGVVERFRIEARATAQLHHDNIVQLRAHGEAGEILWIEMDLVEGDSLETLLRAGPLPWERVARLLSQAAGALAYAHSCGIIHRDVKPANLLIPSATDRVLVTDFGVARIRDTARITATGMTVGTPGYMSPEQFYLDKELTPATDQYSLGVVAYQMITGTIPPPPDPDRPAGRITISSRTIRLLAPACPLQLAALAQRMLALDPRRRWPDLKEVSTAAAEIAATGVAAATSRPGDYLITALRRLLP
ncbi:MAG TPA: serine/threonine-protein kinase [Gemmatimonadales bacterium]